MNDRPDLPTPLGLDPGDLDGHTIDELSDYLDRGRTPRDDSIEDSPGCRLALQSMERLRRVAPVLLDADAAHAAPVDEGWLQRVLAGIALDARAGRRIPLSHPSPDADLGITEGAVRGLVRAAEAEVDGVLVGRCRIDGDVTTPGAPIEVRVDASVAYGIPILPTAALLRDAIAARLARHTELNVAAVDVVVHDVHELPASAGGAE